MGVSDVRLLKRLEDENAKLKRLLAEQMLGSPEGWRERPVYALAEGAVLKDQLGKN